LHERGVVGICFVCVCWEKSVLEGADFASHKKKFLFSCLAGSLVSESFLQAAVSLPGSSWLGRDQSSSFEKKKTPLKARRLHNLSKFLSKATTFGKSALPSSKL
jgi:hypothetical protein